MHNLDQAFFELDAEVIEVDHSTVEEIGPAAALLLISECSRVTKYGPDAKLLGKFKGMDSKVWSILKKMGYFEYYPRVAKFTPKDLPSDGKVYISHCTGSGVDPISAEKLLNEFSKSALISSITQKRIGKSLIECMENVAHHAYDGRQERRLGKNWWMMGYRDPESHEVYFAFLDQGIGMPATLRFKFRDKWLLAPTDEELVLKAFAEPMSQTREKKRGLGLTGLRKYLEKTTNAELFVHSWNSRCFLGSNKNPHAEHSNIALHGTLLAWRIKPDTVAA